MTNEEVLNAFANKMLSAVDGIEAFGKEQIPDFIEQVLVYNFWESVATATLSILFLTSLFVVFVWSIKHANKKGWGKEEPSCEAGLVMMFTLLSLLSWVILTPIKDTKTALKIHLAPKVYIVDYLRNQIK